MSPAANYFKIRSATIIDSLLARWHRPARRRSAVPDDQLAFIDLALARNALTFGQFTLKSGRESPYFFNAGLFSDGEAAAILGRCYAAALVQSGIHFDMLFGPAYKGIPLVTATAIAFADLYRKSVPYAFNRKEAKEHGEGGSIVGAPLAGGVVIVDDVIAAGTAKRESIDLIRAAGATPVAVLLALDRQERGLGAKSAAQELEAEHGIRCVSILTLDSLVEALARRTSERIAVSAEQLTALRAYQARYGVR
jgi:orotate phosphoribosyltransferase